jgi:hypothetical protein
MYTTSRALAFVALLGTCKAGTPGFTNVTFERTPCFGTCPVYKVSVSGDGTVTFVGERNVDSVGTYVSHIDSGAVKALGQAFADADYADMRATYDHTNCPEYATDLSRVLTSITTAEGTKRVDHDLGCSQAPAKLAELYRKFDEIVGTAKWVGRR